VKATAFIVDAVRTPRARRKGKFSSVHPVDLMTYPLNALIKRNRINPEAIEDVVAGVVTQTGEQSWCVARNAVLAAGWPHTVPATTVNRLCGSGQQAVNFVAGNIVGGNYQLAIGGGLEHMTRVPMFSDTGGEESPMLKRLYPDLVNQGLAAEILCEEYKFTRGQLDEFALRSQHRAAQAQAEGRFRNSVIPVEYKAEDGTMQVLSSDDNIRADSTIEGLGKLKPAFKETGVITAGNASAIVDGAAAVLLCSEQKLPELGLRPRARIVGSAVVGSPPRIMLTGPIAASKLCLEKTGIKKDQIDIWEINEAFAPVPLATIRDLDIDPDKVNPNGGGISLGHPLGATGAMLIGMAVDELERTKKRYAMVTMCIGLGMGIATIIERI
jgi:acetyl-CoA acetyltransferase family protein